MFGQFDVPPVLHLGKDSLLLFRWQGGESLGLYMTSSASVNPNDPAKVSLTCRASDRLTSSTPKWIAFSQGHPGSNAKPSGSWSRSASAGRTNLPSLWGIPGGLPQLVDKPGISVASTPAAALLIRRLQELRL